MIQSNMNYRLFAKVLVNAKVSIKVDTNIWFLQNQVIPNVIGLYARPILI